MSLVREEGYGNSEKLSDLLLRLGLSDRKLNHIKELANLLDTAVDYTHTDKVIALEREKAKTYLKRFVHNGR